MSKSLLLVGGLAVASGCAADLELSESVQFAIPGGDTCQSYGCGQNSPEMEGLVFWELNERGVENTQHLVIASFGKQIGSSWVEMRPDVVDDELVGRSRRWPYPILVEGAAVIGAKFTVKSTRSAAEYYVRVINAQEMPMWTAPVTQTWSYHLEYTSNLAPTNGINLCKGAGVPTGDPMNPLYAVMFADDRIDPEKIQVYGTEPDWFTIGCAGSALAKQHLTGNTKAAAKLTQLSTTEAQRTANLKMLTADYCGTGDPFTVAGIELRYQTANNAIGPVAKPLPGDPVEARWNEHGAICVNTPRIKYSPTPYSDTMFPDLGAELAAFGCTLPPPCGPTTYTSPYSFGGADVVSTNY